MSASGTRAPASTASSEWPPLERIAQAARLAATPKSQVETTRTIPAGFAVLGATSASAMGDNVAAAAPSAAFLRNWRRLVMRCPRRSRGVARVGGIMPCLRAIQGLADDHGALATDDAL